jgi:cell shape-determining protein MreC
MRIAKISFLIAVIGLSALKAQSPAPMVVQAAASTMPAKPAANAPAAVVSSVPEAIAVLEQVKAANDEVLAKQKAALEKLDELQQAVDQLRIFAKRG